MPFHWLEEMWPSEPYFHNFPLEQNVAPPPAQCVRNVHNPSNHSHTDTDKPEREREREQAPARDAAESIPNA